MSEPKTPESIEHVETETTKEMGTDPRRELGTDTKRDVKTDAVTDSTSASSSASTLLFDVPEQASHFTFRAPRALDGAPSDVKRPALSEDMTPLLNFLKRASVPNSQTATLLEPAHPGGERVAKRLRILDQP